MDKTPSAFHLTQLALMKAQMQWARDAAERRAMAEYNEMLYRSIMAEHEVQMIEVRELRSDPDSERQAAELIERVRLA